MNKRTWTWVCSELFTRKISRSGQLQWHVSQTTAIFLLLSWVAFLTACRQGLLAIRTEGQRIALKGLLKGTKWYYICNTNSMLLSNLVAQSIEQQACNLKDVGSIPTLGWVFLCPCVGTFSMTKANTRRIRGILEIITHQLIFAGSHWLKLIMCHKFRRWLSEDIHHLIWCLSTDFILTEEEPRNEQTFKLNS